MGIKIIIQDEYIYRFNSADEAISWLSYYLLNKRTEVILSNLITNLQREVSDLRLRTNNLENLSYHHDNQIHTLSSTSDDEILNYFDETFEDLKSEFSDEE